MNLAIEKYFREEGCRLVRRCVLADNQARRAGVEKFGYKPYEIIYEKRF